MFVDAGHGYNKINGRSITGLFLFVVSTLTTWSYKVQTAVQTSTFLSKFTALKKSDKESFMIRYSLIIMGINVSKPTPIPVDNMSVVLKANNHGRNLNNKTVALS